MKLTNEDLKWLAEFAGLEAGKLYWKLNGKCFCYLSGWNPLEDWNCLRLVLEALVKKSHMIRLTLYEGKGEVAGQIWCNIFSCWEGY